MLPAAHEYKQLHSGNRYHPLDLSDLTVSARAYRNRTDYCKVSKSAVFGYPAHHLELGLPKKEKLKTKFPPFICKPQVTEDPTPINNRPLYEHYHSGLQHTQTNMVIYTNTSTFTQNDSQSLAIYDS